MKTVHAILLILLIMSVYTTSMFILYIVFDIKSDMYFIDVSLVGMLLLTCLINFLILSKIPVIKRTSSMGVGILKSKSITIKSDGSVRPKDAPLRREDNVYVLIGDVEITSGHGIVAERDNITIDGGNHLLKGRIGKKGASGYGIYLNSRRGIKIMNLRIQEFHTGIFLQGSSDNEIIGNTIENNERFGILLDSSNNNKITGNRIKKNPAGIWICHSSNNNIIDNDIENSEVDGILLWESSNNNEIAKNRLVNCGLEIWDAYNSRISDNFVNGKPLVYFENEHNKVIKDINAGQVILVKCRNMVVENLNFSNTTVGIELCKTTNSIVRNNRLVNNKYGILLWLSSNNEIIGNSIENNYVGIFATGGSSDNRVLLNDFINNEEQVNIPPFTNFWDDGSKGNYWSNYKGVDANGDGIGDTPYVINSNNADHYPLMKPYRGFLKTLMSPYEISLEDMLIEQEFQVETPSLLFGNEWGYLLLKLPGEGRVKVEGEVEWLDPGVVRGEAILPVKPLRAGGVPITISVSRNSKELKKTVWLNVVPLEDMYLPPPPQSPTSKVCSACGANNSIGARFCRKCGTPFTF